MQNRHINRKPSWLAVLGTAGTLLTLGACAGVRVEAEQHVPDLEPFRTYAWSTERSTLDESLAASVRERVARDLAARGFEEASPSEADLLVREEARIETETVALDPFYSPFYTAERNEDGLLTITLVDARSGDPVWHGTARRRLRTAAQGYGFFRLTWVDTTEERDWKVPEMVDAIFERFPVGEASAPAPES